MASSSPVVRGVGKTGRSIRFGRTPSVIDPKQSQKTPELVPNVVAPTLSDSLTVATNNPGKVQIDEGADSALDFMSDFPDLPASSLNPVTQLAPAVEQADSGAPVLEPLSVVLPVDVSEQDVVEAPPRVPIASAKRTLKVSSSRAQRFKSGDAQIDKASTPLSGGPDIGHLKLAVQKEVVDVRRSMAAAKVLTPLVAAVSFHPGFGGDEVERTRALSTMLVGVHHCAMETAEVISSSLGRDVPQWMVTQLMQSLSEVVAEHWQRKGSLDSQSLNDSMRLVFAKSKEMSRLIEHASQNVYQSVQNQDDAQNRVAVSTISAAWKIYDWVTHPQLAMDQSGASPAVFFTYGQEPMDLVNTILVRCVDEAQAFLLNINDADMRTAHLQASIGRMTALVGAEYVTQTRHVMTWIAEPELSISQRDDRTALACEQLETRVLPHVFEWARTNFIRIEDGALRAMEVLNEKKHADQQGDLSASSDDSRSDTRGG